MISGVHCLGSWLWDPCVVVGAGWSPGKAHHRPGGHSPSLHCPLVPAGGETHSQQLQSEAPRWHGLASPSGQSRAPNTRRGDVGPPGCGGGGGPVLAPCGRKRLCFTLEGGKDAGRLRQPPPSREPLTGNSHSYQNIVLCPETAMLSSVYQQK